MNSDTYFLLIFTGILALYVIIVIVVISCLSHKRVADGGIPLDKDYKVCNALKSDGMTNDNIIC